MGMPLYFLRRHAFLFVPFFYIGRKIHAFFHVGRGCLGALARHTLVQSFPSPMGANASRGWSGSHSAEQND